MTVSKVMIDTNILLRSTIPKFPFHEQAKQLINTQLESGSELWISRQIVREYIGQVTRSQTFMNPLTMEQVEAQIQTMHSLFKIADNTEVVMRHLLLLLKEFPTGGKQVHDANIVATMLAYSIDTLLTINVEDMRRFESRIKLISLASA